MFQVASPNDDYRENSSGNSYRGDSTLDLWTAGDSKQAYRFTNFQVPRGTLIASARLEVYAFGSNYLDRALDGTALGEAVGNAPAWTGAHNEITSAPKTAASVHITGLPPWTANTHNFLADVTSIVQEIVDRPDYAAGNAIKLFLIANATSSFRRTKTADANIAYGAKLTIQCEPYYVRPVFFVASDDDAFDPQWKAKLKTAWTLIRQFFGTEMQRDGYVYRTFNVELDTDGLPKIFFVRGQHASSYYADDPGGTIQQELEQIFSKEQAVVSVTSKFGPYTGGGGGSPRGGYAFVKDYLSTDFATTIEGQLQIFCDQSIPPDSPPGYEGATRAELASSRFGGMMHETGHAFGVQHSFVSLDVVRNGHFGAANYFTGRHDCVYEDPPIISPGTALILNNSAFFRSETCYSDNTPPTLSYSIAPTIAAGESLPIQFTVADGQTAPAVLVINFAGASYQFDVSGLGNPATFPRVFRFVPPLEAQATPYQIGFELFDASANRLIDDQGVGNPSAREFTVIAPHVPTLDPGEVVWMEDDFPAGARVVGPWNLQTLIKASGSRGHRHPNQSGFHQVYFEDVAPAARLSVGATDALTGYVYIAPGASVEMIGFQWRSGSDWKRAYWGADRIPTDWVGQRLRIGDLPPAGQWVRLRVPSGDVELSDRVLEGFAFMVYGAGDVYVDRIGKVPEVPALDPSEIVWAEDGFPPGASSGGTWNWQSAFKMSGTMSHQHIATGGFVDAYFFDADPPTVLGANDTFTTYVYLVPGSAIDMIRLWWRVGGGWVTAHWGANLADDLRAGELPPTGSWVRLALPAADLQLGGQTINGFQVTTSGTGTMYVDRIGRRP